MTKFILHGGAREGRGVENAPFFREATLGLPDPVRVLCVYFAKENKAQWPDLLEEDKTRFASASPEKKFHFAMAGEDIQAFKKQIAGADVVYLRGGDTGLLKRGLEMTSGLEDLLKGKVIAGVSAGAHVLARHFFLKGNNEFCEGLGMLPIKLFCHYTKDKSDKAGMLKEYGNKDDRVFCIPEEEFFVLEQ